MGAVSPFSAIELSKSAEDEVARLLIQVAEPEFPWCQERDSVRLDLTVDHSEWEVWVWSGTSGNSNMSKIPYCHVFGKLIGPSRSRPETET